MAFRQNSKQSLARLRQNKDMSFFEECLSLGQWLGEDRSRALYKYLLQKKKNIYKNEAEELLKYRVKNTFIANGEIEYFIEKDFLKFRSRQNGTDDFTDVIRELKLSRFKLRNIYKIQKFFAQVEVDVIHNFPLPGVNPQEESGFCIYTYPYYELDYYSNGKGKIRGLFNKLKTDDSELLRKLSA